MLRQGLKEYSSWPTFPQLYIDGEFFGGCDITVGMSSFLIFILVSVFVILLPWYNIGLINQCCLGDNVNVNIMLYETSSWAVMNQHENKLSIAVMRMLRWMCRKIRWDMIRNDNIRELG